MRVNEGVTYHILPVPNQHVIEVSLVIDNPDPAGETFTLPNWIPGSYMIRDFSKHIVQLRAEADGQEVAITKLDKSSWSCQCDAKSLVLHYQVYAWDLSVRGAHVDNTHAFYNASSVCLAVTSREAAPCYVNLQRPAGEQFQDWRVATTLPRQQAQPYAFGAYQAACYADLLDYPVEMGTFTLASFTAHGIKHDVVLTGKHYADLPRLCADLQRICEQQLSFFGAPYPIEQYLFLVHVLGNGYGGLEHRDSCALHCSRTDLPLAGDDRVHDDYHNFLTLCSHEYFHLWNVKRIKPAAFLPYQLQAETHTTLLWVFEGFTRYYEDLHVVRAGIVDHAQFLNNFSKVLSSLQRMPARQVQSVADSSFDAWTKLYKADENAVNASINYYTKGAIIACGLDLSIRLKTNHTKSLDDVMAQLWAQFGDQSRGLAEGEIETIINALVDEDLSELYQSWVYGTDEIDLTDLFQAFGVKAQMRIASSQTDLGGVQDVPDTRADLGIRGQHSESGLKVNLVLTDSAAQVAGISPGDVILAFDGLACQSNWEAQIARFKPGQDINVHYFRRDELHQTTVTLQASPANIYVLTPDDDEPTYQQNRQAWLGEIR